MKENKVILLGTNGWYDTGTGNTICTLIDSPDCYIVLDAGNGLYRLNDYMNEDKPVYLFLSHFHIDHISGLHMLMLLNITSGLTFIGQKGAMDFLNMFLDEPFTAQRKNLPFRTEVLEVPAQLDTLPFMAEVLPMTHSVPTLGIRIELGGRVISYCPDTGYCDNTVMLARNADLVITECAYLPGESHEGWPHLNPQKAAGIADEAGAKKLLLTHFDASRYTDHSIRKKAEEAAREIFPETSAGFDGDCLLI